MTSGKTQRAPKQPQQSGHQGKRQKREGQATLAMKGSLEEVGIHMDAEPGDGHDAHGVLEYGDGKNEKGEADSLPEARKEYVLR